MKLLERLFPARRIARPTANRKVRGMWEFFTTREDVVRAYISPDMRSGFGVFAELPRGERVRRLTGYQLKMLLSQDESQYLRPELLD